MSNIDQSAKSLTIDVDDSNLNHNPLLGYIPIRRHINIPSPISHFDDFGFNYGFNMDIPLNTNNDEDCSEQEIIHNEYNKILMCNLLMDSPCETTLQSYPRCEHCFCLMNDVNAPMTCAHSICDYNCPGKYEDCPLFSYNDFKDHKQLMKKLKPELLTAVIDRYFKKINSIVETSIPNKNDDIVFARI